MKVLYFTRGQSPHDVRFTQALSQTDHQVFVLCLDGSAVRQWPAGITEVGWENTNPAQGWGNTLKLVKQLKEVIAYVQPDLIHAGPIQRVAFLAALSGFHPLISMSWGSDMLLEADKNWWWQWVTRFTLKHTAVLVGDCACVGKKAASFGFPLENYKMFPWGVDLTHFSPEGSRLLREELGWQDKVVLLSNRSMEPLYGVEIIAKAFVECVKTNPDLRLLMFGKGSQEASIKEFLYDQGLFDKIHFGGFATTEQLPDVYRSADLYLSASHSDGSSVSLMEALASGLPVVVSDIPGNLEWVTESEQGWLFKDKDAADLASKIHQAVVHKGDWAKIKKHNRQLAERRADWTKNFPVLLEAYDAAYKKGIQHG